jgi:dCMP deaminase
VEREAELIARPSFSDVFMAMAWALSRRGTCRRLKVGCVIASADHHVVHGVGYNGNAAGLPNDCDTDVPGACGDIHAEANAAIHCDAPRFAPKIVYCTHAPCARCAKYLIQLGGVARVVYETPYRLTAGLDLLERAGVQVLQHEAAAACPACGGR